MRGGKVGMTVSAQVKQTLASLKGIHATLETLVSVEKIPAKKEILQHNIQKVTTVINDLEKRLGLVIFVVAGTLSNRIRTLLLSNSELSTTLIVPTIC